MNIIEITKYFDNFFLKKNTYGVKYPIGKRNNLLTINQVFALKRNAYGIM